MVKNKKIIVFSFFVLVMVLFFTFSDYKLVLSVKNELGTVQMTKISSMIRNDVSDDQIIKKIEEDPSLLEEKCFDCELDYQTSFITAVLSKRIKLIKYMLKNGADVEKTISKLDEYDYLQEFSDYLRKIDEQIKAEKKGTH